MIERDYILRIMQQFFEALAKVLKRDGKIEDGDVALMQERFDEMYEQFFKQSADYFYQISKEDIVEDLFDEGRSEEDTFAKIQMIAELMYHDGLIKTNIIDRCNLLEKSLYAFEYLEQNSRTFSWERGQKIEDIRKTLNEVEI